MPSAGKSPERILVVRNDRIGDLVLTTPALSALRGHFPRARIDLLCSAYAAALLAGNPHLDNVLTDRGLHDSSDLEQLVETVRTSSYDCAVVMVHSLKNARLVRRAGTPLRIGPLVRWYAPLFYNRAIYQHRSRGLKSEAIYNLDLLGPLDVPAHDPPPPCVIPTRRSVEEALAELEKLFPEQRGLPLVVVHPSMGGSALNWPEGCYTELLSLLCGGGRFPVLVTGSGRDEEMIGRICAPLSASPNLRIKTDMSLEGLIGMLSTASAVVAPSTGPLHLAAALGVPSAGIYSPVRAHHPERWGPFGTDKCRVFLPPVDCPGKLRCLGTRCRHYDCMGLIDPGEMSGHILSLVKLRMQKDRRTTFS